MLIAHTSDWHAGRVFRGVSRLPEMQDVLANLADDLEREKVDILLMSGDVFDCGAPSAEAERAVFRFFRRVGEAGIQTVVIAGNHDSPSRVEAWGGLTELVNVRAIGRPCRPADGGLVELQTRAGEVALVAAVPFASPGDLVAAADLAEGATAAHQRYADGLRAAIASVTAPFRADAVNLLMLHTHLEGAAFSGSERQVHLGDEWAATAQSLPSAAQYVALGHIHKPQRVETAPAPAYYAGSPLQLDFGEAGEEKGFVIVDARARQPVSCERRPYRGGRPLKKVRLSLEVLEREADLLKDAGWLHVTVPLAVPDRDLNARVRRLLPNAVRVEAEVPLPAETVDPEIRPARDARPRDLFADHLRRQQMPADPALLDAFDALLARTLQG
jgi:exonuclease SbcD